MQKMPPAIFTGIVFGLLQSFGLSGDKKILRCSYLHNRISYTDKMTSLY